MVDGTSGGSSSCCGSGNRVMMVKNGPDTRLNFPCRKSGSMSAISLYL